MKRQLDDGLKRIAELVDSVRGLEPVEPIPVVVQRPPPPERPLFPNSVP